MAPAPRSLANPLLALKGMRLLFLALFASGCLLPQDDTVLDFPDNPTRFNRPPQILGTISPSQNVVTLLVGEQCPPTEFRVSVKDLDVGDYLYARWFLDIIDSNNVTTTFEDETERLPPNNQEVRTLGRFISRSASAQALGLSPSGQKFLRLVVADRPFSGPNPIPVPDPLPDGGVNPAETDSFEWRITAKAPKLADCSE
jgi:hypothetical protein